MAIIELVLLLPLYSTVFLTTLELGHLFYNRAQLSQAAAEGGRAAAGGAILSQVRAIMRQTAPAGLTDAQIVIDYNSAKDGTGVWLAAADNARGTANVIPLGFPCRVRLINWSEPLLAGSWFNGLSSVDHGAITMTAHGIMVRG